MKHVFLLLLAMSLFIVSCVKDEGDDPIETCNDGILNQNETAVDCGGICAACASCTDGIQNQGEIGTDCGGPCSACTNCVTCVSPIQGSNDIIYCEDDFATQADYDDAVANAEANGRTCN